MKKKKRGDDRVYVCTSCECHVATGQVAKAGVAVSQVGGI